VSSTDPGSLNTRKQADDKSKSELIVAEKKKRENFAIKSERNIPKVVGLRQLVLSWVFAFFLYVWCPHSHNGTH
jgi:hypothetical protein